MRMRVARLLLCCVLLEDYSTNLSSAISSSDVHSQSLQYDSSSSALSSATNPTLPENNLPTFAWPIGNVTAAIGKEAVLSCTIKRLGNYKVGWLRAEDHTVLSMGQRTVTHSQRFFVSLENTKMKNQTLKDDEEITWHLHIKQLRDADRGCYMCQLNTTPMLNQLGCVDVLVPPDILSSGTSAGEVAVAEGENVTLVCNASGRPAPQVLWRREKNSSILIRGMHETLTKVESLTGERLELARVDRRQMGAYLCIAKNEVPPAVSKRVNLRVNFRPSAKVSNQLLGSPLETDVVLRCFIEAFPKTINLWKRDDQVIMSGERYEIDEQNNPDEEWKTTIELTIKSLQKSDLGKYICTAESSLGKAEADVRIYEIKRETTPTRATSPDWGKVNKGKSSKSNKQPKLNRIYPQSSTSPIQKTTARLTFGKLTTSTTMNPRISLNKDKSILKHNEMIHHIKSSAVEPMVVNRIILLLTALYFLFLR